MSRSSRLMRVAAPLVTVAMVAGITVLATRSTGKTASACLAKNTHMAKLKTVDGAAIGKVIFGVHSSCTTKVKADLAGLTEGFHGFHVHTTGICDPEATDASQNPSPFFTAGSHWNRDTTDHGNHTGDMPPLMGMESGDANLFFTTDRFRVRNLMDDDGSAVIVHGSPDNLAHIPGTTSGGADRYHSHVYDTMGADEDSKKTGDAGARFACGVVKKIN